VVAARKLQRRSARDREGAFLVEGRVVVGELLASELEVTDLFVASGSDLGELVAAAEAAGVRVAEVPESVVALLADTRTPQGVVAVARLPASSIPDHATLVVVLADVRDPGNAGTLVRTAYAAGADAVVFGPGAVDPFNAKTLRAASGAAFHVPVIRGVALETVLELLSRRGIRTVGTAASASVRYDEVDLTAPVAFVLGNEAWGIAAELGAHLDENVSIPMPGPMESLNVATAGAILLFEAVRQRMRV
jgi:RNA methyltransferase, TrmH family